MSKRIGIVYYSHSGNTKRLAGLIAKATGGDLIEIEPVAPYPKEYKAVVAQAKQEIRDGLRPPIKPLSAAIESYDTVLVGTPNWWSTIAPPVATFLADNNLGDKLLVPFCTHGGGGQARCFVDMAALSGGAMREGFAAYSDDAKPETVMAWLRGAGCVD